MNLGKDLDPALYTKIFANFRKHALVKIMCSMTCCLVLHVGSTSTWKQGLQM